MPLKDLQQSNFGIEQRTKINADLYKKRIGLGDLVTRDNAHRGMFVNVCGITDGLIVDCQHGTIISVDSISFLVMFDERFCLNLHGIESRCWHIKYEEDVAFIDTSLYLLDI